MPGQADGARARVNITVSDSAAAPLVGLAGTTSAVPMALIILGAAALSLTVMLTLARAPSA